MHERAGEALDRDVGAGAGPLTQLLGESLLILGWVANWRPLEIFLYDWAPIVRRRALYRRLAGARGEVPVASHLKNVEMSSDTLRLTFAIEVLAPLPE